MGLIGDFHSWTNKFFENRFPRISLYYYHKPRAFFARRRHPIRQLFEGKQLSNSTKTSCIYFTVHKSATSFMSEFLQEVSVAAGMVHIDYNMYFHTQGKEGLKRQQDPDFIHQVFHNRGYIYGPLRYFVPVHHIEKYRIVLVVRDPRDILTSQYFSVRNSHPQITAAMIERRESAQNMTVDEHVRSQADRFLKTFETYAEQFLGQPNVVLLRYEEMISAFPEFLKTMNSHCDFQLTADQLKALDRSNEFAITTEDSSRHKRKVSAGDYKEKLQPETIVWLNEKFESVLNRFGYTIE